MTRLLGTDRATLVRRRYAAGSRDANGRWVRGAATDTSFVGNVQDLPGKTRNVEPSGTRRSERREVYVGQRDFLRPEDDRSSPKIEADEVLIDGLVYKVQSVETDSGLITHTTAIVELLREGPR